LALNSPDFVVVDHRQVGWVQMDNDRYAAEIQSGWRSAADIRMEIEEVLAANERSLAVILTFRGTALGDVGGGRFELPLGLISLLDGERGARAEWFDPSDRDAMLARFTELAGQDDVLGDSPPERVWARYIDSFNSSDFGALERILAPDYAFEDRRTLGYEPAEGIDGGVGMLRSARKASADLRIEADVVLACDERVIALLVAWRGRGVKAGELEIPMGVVAVVEDDRLKLHELFNPDDRAAIMARFAELGGKQSGRQERQSERLMEEVRRALNAREYERLAELVAEDWYFVDHRALGWEEGHGRDKCEAIMRSFFDASPDVRFDFGDLLAADDRVMVVHAAIRGHGRKAGEHETVTGAVYLIEGGLWAGVDFYEPDDRWAMTARYAELGGGLEPLGDRPPERLYAEFLRRWAAGDTGKIVELCADGYRHNDHRKLGWEAVDSLAALWDFVASAVAGTSGFHFDVDEVLACDDRVLALRGTWHAHSPETGSEMEFKLGHVAVVEHGLLVRQDHYDYDDTRAMLARFAELGGTQPALGNRPSERVMAEVERLLNARDYERFAELVPDDWYWIDHRALGWEEAHGREECLRHMRSTFDASPDVRLEYGDVLACDDNVIAMHTAWRGRGLKAGELEVEVGAVFLVEDGLWAGVDFYEPDDHHAMIVRYAELGGGAALLGDRPPERFFRRWIPIAAAGDVDGVAELVAEDFVRIDHRALGWEPLEGRQANVGLWRSAYESAAHIRMEVDEVLACDARVIALRFTWHGLAGGTIGGGDFAVGVGQVNVIEDGIWRSCDQYDTNDREAMLVRYRELTGAADLRGERAPERFYAEYARLWAAADRDRLLELIDEKWVLTDRRALALWEEMRGSEGARKILESSFRGVREPQFTLQEVLACDESVIAARVAWSGFGQGDAQFSNEMGLVSVVRDGRELTLDVYDADDRQGMVARYVELGGGLGMLGETRIERAFKEYAKRYAAHDLDGMLALMTDDFVHVDRRKMAWEELDKERFAAEVQSVWAGTSDVRLDVNEVIALSESLLLVISTYRGAAASEVGAGEFEYPVGFLVVSAGDRYSRFEWFEPDDREAMLARYRELSETWPSVGDRPSERVIAAMYQGLNARDYERLAALVLDDCYVFDHRALGWEEAHGRDQILAIMRSWLDASPKLGVDYQVLACDDEVLVAHMAIHGQGVKAGELEITLGAVHLVKDGRWGGIDFYDPHDRQAMIARYVELGGGLGKLGDTASERLFAEYARRYAARDYDGVLAMMSEDYVQVDHRSLGWAQIGKEQNAAEIRSVWAGTTDVRPEVEEVLAADDHALACICTYRGSADASAGGGQFEYPVGFLLVTDGERSTRVEWFDADDREAMLARYRELCTAVPEAVRLGMEILASWNAHDIDRAMELYAEDIEFIDHRALGAEPLRGQAAVRELHRAAFEVFPDNVQQLDEVIAADERVIAFRVTIRGRSPDAAGGEGEIPLGGVDVFEDGKLTSVDLFEPDDIAAIVRRYVELGGGQGPLGDRPPERFFAEFCRRWASGDVERILELYSSDYRNVDHRQVGWEEIDGPKALRDFVESALGAVTDLRCEVDEVLACDARAIALCTTWRGHSAETGGEFEFKFGYAAVVENGLLVRQDHFDHGDTRRMLARYEELSKGPAARTILRRAELCNARKLDELRSLYAEDFELIDHRPMPWDGARGGEEMTSLIEGAFELSPDAEVTVDILDDDGGEVVAWRQTWSGTFGAGGRAESVIDTVTVVRDHRFVRSELFEPDQEDEMRRRLAELRGSSGVADEVVVRDRRGLPKRDLAGIEAYRELIGADGPGELVRTDGELRLFRQRDDPALLVISRWREGAIVEAIVTRAPQFADAWMAALSLQSPGEVIDAFPGAFVLALDDGFAAVRASDRHQERFSARDAAVERAEELAQLRGWMDMARNFVRAINARDWDAFLSMYATDYVLVDHRLMGWGELEGPAKMVEVLKGTIELAPSASIDLIEFLDFDLNAGLGAVRQTYTGEWDGGAYEIAWDSIMVVDDGRFTRGEVFGVDQVDAMRARMAELLAGD
jgi:ketosteroid isomerase-like protein